MFTAGEEKMKTADERTSFLLFRPGLKESVIVSCLQGPFVQVEELMETFRRCTLPESELLLSALNSFPVCF